MKILYDKGADALYLRLKTGRVSKTVKMKDRVIVDVDKAGGVLGVEILGVSKQISKKSLESIEVGFPVAA